MSIFSFSLLSQRTLFAILFFLIIGTFWLLGSLQEPIFYHLVGRQYHPQVNVISFFCIIPLLLWYMASLNRWRPEVVLRGATLLYAAFFAVMAGCLMVPGIGLSASGPNVYNIVGWAFFAITKTYGSLMVTLFWTYATSVTTVEEAKTSFPFITVCAQVGSFVGATLVRVGSGWGMPALIWVAVAGMLLILMILRALRVSHVEGGAMPSTPPMAGVFEGFWLVCANNYLRGILVVSTAYLVITAFFDYQLHFLAHLQYPTIQDFAWFKGVYGQVVNAATLLLALGGTRWFLRYVGVALCLLLYPLLTAGCVIIAWWWPTLWVVAGVMVFMRAFSFGFNNPTKEITYIPETEEVRFKAKGWIDVVGYRAAFAAGSQITSVIAEPYAVLVNTSAALSLGIVAVWGYYAMIVGRHFVVRTRD